MEIEEFCRELMRRPELDAVFRHYSGNGFVLTTLELRDFLGDQGEDASLAHAKTLIHTFELNNWGTQPSAPYINIEIYIHTHTHIYKKIFKSLGCCGKFICNFIYSLYSIL